MTKSTPARSPGGNIQQNHCNQDQSSKQIKEEISNCRLISCNHNLSSLTTQIPKIQKSNEDITPNPNTTTDGLSSEGIKYGTTAEPKNNWPNPNDKSESLSSWEWEKIILINFQNNIESKHLSNISKLTAPAGSTGIPANSRLVIRVQ